MTPHVPPTQAELDQLRGILGLSLLSTLSKEDCYRLITEVERFRAREKRLRELCREVADASTTMPSEVRYKYKSFFDRLGAAAEERE